MVVNVDRQSIVVVPKWRVPGTQDTRMNVGAIPVGVPDLFPAEVLGWEEVGSFQETITSESDRDIPRRSSSSSEFPSWCTYDHDDEREIARFLSPKTSASSTSLSSATVGAPRPPGRQEDGSDAGKRSKVYISRKGGANKPRWDKHGERIRSQTVEQLDAKLMSITAQFLAEDGNPPEKSPVQAVLWEERPYEVEKMSAGGKNGSSETLYLPSQLCCNKVKLSPWKVSMIHANAP